MKFWCQQEHLVTSVICCKFKKNLFEVWFYTIFSWLYMYIATGQGQTTPVDKVLISTEMSCHFHHLLQVSKKCLKSDFIQFFHDYIHVYSPKAEADNSLRTKFLCQQEHLVTLVICCKFQKTLLWSLILTFFSFYKYIYIAPGQGAYSPQGTKFWCQQKLLVTSVICC